MSKTKVAILDDHELFRTGICEIVNHSPDFEITCSAGTPENLYNGFKHHRIDLLLLDIRLKDANGLDVLKAVKEKSPEVRVIMLTMHSEASFVRKMIEHGADGYLLKDITPEELLKTLRNIVKLGQYFDPSISAVIIQSLQHKDILKKSGIEFTDPEIEVLTLISEGLTAEEIAKKVFKSSRTIEGYRQKLLDKTNSKNIAALISWAYKNGVLKT